MLLYALKLMVLGLRGFGGHLSSVQNFSLRQGHRNPRGSANTFCSGRNTNLPEKRLRVETWREPSRVYADRNRHSLSRLASGWSREIGVLEMRAEPRS